LFFILFSVIGFFDDLIKLRFKKRRDKYLAENELEWFKKHEEDDSKIMTADNNNKRMEDFLSLIFEFLGEKVDRDGIQEKVIHEERREVYKKLKDDIYKLYFIRSAKEQLVKIKEIWMNKKIKYESWDKFLVSKNLTNKLEKFQEDILDYLGANFQFSFQENKKLDDLVNKWFEWISMPYAIQELSRQKRKWIQTFNKKAKEKKNTVRDVDGLRGSFRFVLEFIISGGILFWLFTSQAANTTLQIPFFKNFTPDIGAGYIFFGMFVIVAFANAVNLTDGLDGLAIVPIMVAMTTLGLLVYMSGHVVIARYLHITYISGIGELSIFALTVTAAGVGFLWFNTYPAQIFMGDVGSLALGASFGSLLVMSKNELIGVILGGIFVMEALSVIIQVGVYKTKKVRVFKMAPIHHHFEKMGLHENKIIVRFWVIAVILALISIATIKIR
jgi:phospho-N-acetylmuramoyl-pentapeptide-transferase